MMRQRTHFELDFARLLRFNSGAMKSLAAISLALLSALSLSSCNCTHCGGYNPDYLRDVPTNRSQLFNSDYTPVY